MTDLEKDKLIKDLAVSLKETVKILEDVYGNTGYMQLIIYKANEDKYENWLFKARQQISEAEKIISKI